MNPTRYASFLAPATIKCPGLWRESDAAKEVLESRVGAQWIIHGLRPQKENTAISADHLAMFIGLFQPVEGAILVSRIA